MFIYYERCLVSIRELCNREVLFYKIEEFFIDSVFEIFKYVCGCLYMSISGSRDKLIKVLN